MFKYMSVRIESYARFKESLDIALTSTADSMVRVGYLLMQARDTDILRESGYTGMGEFAQKEYGLSPDQTSRFIAIAERFGDGEGRLKDEWQQYGYTKLSEMLTLPQAVVEAIPPEITRDEIRELKEEVKAEQAITPLEVAIEQAEEKAKDPGSEDMPIIERFFLEYFRPAEHASEFVKAMATDWELMWGNKEYNRKAVLDALAPSGIAILEARIPGKGRYMLSFKGESENPVLINIRENTSEQLDWTDVRHGFSDLIEDAPGEWEKEEVQDRENAKSLWSTLYGENFPKIESKPETGTKDMAKPASTGKVADPKKEGKPKSEKKLKIAPAQKKPEPKKEEPKKEEPGKEEPPAAAPTACQPADPVSVWEDDAMNAPEAEEEQRLADDVLEKMHGAGEAPLPNGVREIKIEQAVKRINRIGLDIEDYASRLQAVRPEHNHTYCADLLFDFGEIAEKLKGEGDELLRLLMMRMDAEKEDENEEGEDE